MTRDETKGILAMLDAMFPNAKLATKEAVTVWHLTLEPFNYAEVRQATISFMRTDTTGWPSPAKILACIPRQEERPEGWLWGLAVKAIRNGIYGYKEEFEKLPQEAQEAVGDAENLRQWAMMNESDLSVVESNFYRKLRTVRARKKESYLSLGMTQRKEIESHD